MADVSTFMENGKSNVVSDVSNDDVASEVANNLELPVPLGYDTRVENDHVKEDDDKTLSMG